MDQSPFRSVVADHSADAAFSPMLNAGAVTSITERRIEPTSRALKRFREFVADAGPGALATSSRARLL